MTIPVYVLGAISLSIQVYYSDKIRKRALFIVGCCAPVAIGYLMCVGSKNKHVGYAGMFVLVIGESLSLPMVPVQRGPFSDDIPNQGFTRSRLWL